MRHLLLASLLIALAGLLACAGTASRAPSPEEATLTAVGDPAPAVDVTTMDGDRFDLADQRGKIVLLNFWATWCPPCRQELPEVRDRIWDRFGARDDFALISVAREEDAGTVGRFLAEHDYGWTFATDPERANYARYAEAHIPRNYVIGRDGTILYQSVGFEPEDFGAMVELLAAQLE
ncbi:redoxin domain-containing protein [bacterium]|nr:redoxin domain-containing protein [bacterium]